MIDIRDMGGQQQYNSGGTEKGDESDDTIGSVHSIGPSEDGSMRERERKGGITSGFSSGHGIDFDPSACGAENNTHSGT